MTGSKERQFALLIQVSLEELVPPDHFYRHLERKLDLSCVRKFVHCSRSLSPATRFRCACIAASLD